MRFFPFLACTSFVLLTSVASAQTNFKDHVLPVFKNHCLECHNPEQKKAGLDLSTFPSVLAGSSGGKVVKAGLSDSSPLFMAVDHHKDYVPMPFEKDKLGDKELVVIRNWITEGLVDGPGGKSRLREMPIQSTGKTLRPAEPAFPDDWQTIPLANTAAKPPVIAMDVSPWCNLVAASGHGQVLLFGSPIFQSELSHVGTLSFDEGDVHCLRFSPDGKLLLVAGGSGADSGRAVLYDVKTGKKLGGFGEEFDIILSADISVSNKLIAIGTPTKMVKIFSVKTGKLLHQIKKHTDWVTALRFSPDGTQLASGDRNGGIHVWEPDSAGIIFSLREHKLKITALRWRLDGKLLGSASEDGKVILWDMNDGWATRSISAHVADAKSRYSRRTGVMAMAFFQDGGFVTAGRDRIIQLWNSNGTPKVKGVANAALPLTVGVDALGENVFVGDFAGIIRVLASDDLRDLAGYTTGETPPPAPSSRPE